MRDKLKILFVDDDPKTLLLMEAVLKPHGYDVVLINNGKQAIETAIKEKPDLILMDIMMPDMDGYTIVNRIKKDQVDIVMCHYSQRFVAIHRRYQIIVIARQLSLQ